jgi:glycosyltransferase involved in cell wall biosynthesis
MFPFRPGADQRTEPTSPELHHKQQPSATSPAPSTIILLPELRAYNKAPAQLLKRIGPPIGEKQFSIPFVKTPIQFDTYCIQTVSPQEYHQIVPKYSIVVPFHNEEENVTTLYDRLKAVMEHLGDTFELVFVDDGSRDRTYRLLEEIAAVDSRVLVIKLRRNFGQTSALAAGFDHAQGDFILAMDGDLQHDPDEIPNFLAKLEEGYDVVSGWRAQRGDNFLLRRIPSRAANWLMASLSGVNIHDFGTTFKAYRREVIQNIPLYGEMHRFIPALASWYGATICEIPISNPAREFGKSHYGISRTFRVFFDLLTIRFLLRYMTRPLHFFGTVGALGMLTGSGLALWLLILKLVTGSHVMDVHGPIFVIAGILILAGIQMMGIGLLGELQVRHFHTASHRAPYAVDRILRLRSEESLLQ